MMKKVMLVAAVAMVFGLVGCSKKVDCKCTITTTMDGKVMDVTEQTFKGVEKNCDNVQFEQTSTSGMSQTLSCEQI